MVSKKNFKLLVATRTTPIFVVVPIYFVHDCSNEITMVLVHFVSEKAFLATSGFHSVYNLATFMSYKVLCID